MRSIGVEGNSIFDAASSPIRIKVLKLLASKGPLPYTEIMFEISLDPIRDAGKFVYHLKNLADAGLITLDKKSKKYVITELGYMIVKFSRDVEEYIVVKKGKMLVRTSMLTIEELKRDKISQSLVKEADVPLELAQDIAAEAEEKLIKLKIQYLTAPLIREFINSILVERGLEEYRHKMTRLGMPLYDVSQLIEDIDKKSLSIDYIEKKAANSVLEEYSLLNIVPRKVGDAHLSGDIHIEKIENWFIKPETVFHDIRFYLKKGLLSESPPKTFVEAILTLVKLYEFCLHEVHAEQIMDFFNIFLAPYVKKDTINSNSLFFLIKSLNDIPPFTSGLSIGIESKIPPFLKKVEAVAPGGKLDGCYGDYSEEAYTLAKRLVEAIFETSKYSPVMNPRLIFKVRDKINKNDPLTLKIHELSKSFGLVVYTYLGKNIKASYTIDGLTLDDGWSKIWYVDLMRTGNIGTVFINLPRIACEAKSRRDKFFSLLNNNIQLAVDALKAKRETIEKRLKNQSLRFLSGRKQPYFLLKNSSYTICPLGINIAARIHTDSNSILDEVVSKFMIQIIENSQKYIHEISNNLNMRLIYAQRPCNGRTRLKRQDLDRYGRKILIKEGVSQIHYTDVPVLPLNIQIPFSERIKIDALLQSSLNGGYLSILPISEVKKRDFINLSSHVIDHGLHIFSYVKELTYCGICLKVSLNVSPICPRCGSDTLLYVLKFPYSGTLFRTDN